MKALLVALALLLVAGHADARSRATKYPTTYDAAIKTAVDRWWGDLPVWRLWKAQLWQESRLNPDAESPVGAKGIAQFMEPTWIEVMRQLGEPVQRDRRAAALAISAGAYYQGRLRASWNGRGRTAYEANQLGQASYNAGIGSILRAQRTCGDARLWAEIAPCLYRVTGRRNSEETMTYVQRIERWWREMEAGG